MADESQTLGRNEEDLDTEENPYPPVEGAEQDIAKLEIDVREDPFQVSAIVHKIDRKQLVLTPGFQRKEVWDLTRRSEFIESILLNYPLPPLYFNQDRQGRYIVVDGMQRSSSIYRFLKDQYALEGLERLQWLNGRKFSELSPVLQSRIEDRKLNCYVLKPSVPMGVIYDIFARINRGGMELNRQEIRHGLHQGKSTTLLERLTSYPDFRDWIGHRLTPNRMRDEEACLRCVSFAMADLSKDYKGDMDKFLESSMVRLNTASDSDVDAVQKTFERVFPLVRATLGDDAFRLPTERGRGQLNIAVMESVYRFFAHSRSAWVKKNAVRIGQNYRALVRSPQYVNAVRQATGDTSRVLMRFQLATELLGEHCAD